jgi:hypothetical protein
MWSSKGPSQCNLVSQPRTSPRTTANRLNAIHSTGPRTAAGKLRSSRNALRHGLTAASPVLLTEDPAAYDSHRRAFLNEYQPATPTESQLVLELADIAWRLNRIPLLEARQLSGHDGLAIVEAHRLLQNLSVQATASLVIKHSTSSAPSRPIAASAKPATSNKPRPSSNSTKAKELNTIQPRMASFHNPKLKHTAAS